ncbi:very long chain fatty acid elongase 1-like [Tachypleus tridentatus]|uniref:very long chain fatty acid elongase 1-like n=1 Tax=Tachypleus tridentatus TaxID=6853 RepID=UPI003FCFB1AB
MTYLSTKYSWLCQPISYATDPETMTLVNLGWYYLLLKIFEFTDTIFFILRKKFTHISALHVVHHSSVAWGIWIGMKFGAGKVKSGQNLWSYVLL